MQHKTNQKHQKFHANQLISGKFCSLPVLLSVHPSLWPTQLSFSALKPWINSGHLGTKKYSSILLNIIIIDLLCIYGIIILYIHIHYYCLPVSLLW